MTKEQFYLAITAFFCAFLFMGETTVWSTAQAYVKHQMQPASISVETTEEPVLIQFEYRHKRSGAVVWEADAENVPPAFQPTGMQRSLYLAPQPREWIDLSDAEEADIIFNGDNAYDRMRKTVEILREKNK